MHIVLLKNLFSAFSSIIIFVICRSAKKYARGEVHEENAEANILRVGTGTMSGYGNYEYSFDRNFIIIWKMELVCFFVCFCCFVLVHPVYSKFGCVTIVNREMKSVSAI